MAMLTNRVPEVNGGDGWKSANNQASARRFLQDNSANSVRLRLGDRVFLEDVLKQSIPVGTVLADFVASIDPSTLTSEQTQALAIFKEITT
jgi:hypothetical protein